MKTFQVEKDQFCGVPKCTTRTKDLKLWRTDVNIVKSTFLSELLQNGMVYHNKKQASHHWRYTSRGKVTLGEDVDFSTQREFGINDLQDPSHFLT